MHSLFVLRVPEGDLVRARVHIDAVDDELPHQFDVRRRHFLRIRQDFGYILGNRHLKRGSPEAAGADPGLPLSNILCTAKFLLFFQRTERIIFPEARRPSTKSWMHPCGGGSHN